MEQGAGWDWMGIKHKTTAVEPLTSPDMTKFIQLRSDVRVMLWLSHSPADVQHDGKSEA